MLHSQKTTSALGPPSPSILVLISCAVIVITMVRQAEAVGMHTTNSAASPVLLLTAGDGPWKWRRTRYMLLDGALDEGQTSYPLSAISKLRQVGSAMRTQDGEVLTFEFGQQRGVNESEISAPAPLQLRLGATFEEAGVGSQLWDASIALTLVRRSRLVPLPEKARFVELGCGLALPSLDLARDTSAAAEAEDRVRAGPLPTRAAGVCRRSSQGLSGRQVRNAPIQRVRDA